MDFDAPVDSVVADLAEIEHDVSVADYGRVLACPRPAALPNLLEKADAYEGRATAHIEPGNAELHIVVEDERTEIPQSDLEQVFESFGWLEASCGCDTGDSSLALAILRGIVSGRGGDIRPENSYSDESHVTVALPQAGQPQMAVRLQYAAVPVCRSERAGPAPSGSALPATSVNARTFPSTGHRPVASAVGQGDDLHEMAIVLL